MSIYSKYFISFPLIIIFQNCFAFIKDTHEHDSLKIKRADLLYQKARSIAKDSRYDSAHIYIEKSRAIYQELKEWEKYVLTYRFQAFFFSNQYKMEESINTYNEGINIAKEKLAIDNIQIPILYQKLGLRYVYITEYDLAIKSYLEGIKYFKLIINPEKHKEFMYLNSNLITAYHANHDFYKAIEYLEKTFVLKKKLGIKGNSIALHYTKKGQILTMLRKYQEAKSSTLKALNIYLDLDKILSSLHCYSILARIEMLNNKYKDAHSTLQTGFSLAYKNQDVNGVNRKLAILFLEEGKVYTLQKKYQLAKKSFLKAAEVHPLKNHYWVNNHIGDIYQTLNQYDSALHYYQLGMINLANNFIINDSWANPSIDKIINVPKVISIIKSKAFTLFKRYQSDKNVNAKDLKASYKTSLFTLELIDELLKGYKSTGSKLEWTKFIHESYEQAIQICLTLYKQTGEEKYKQQAFEIAEKSKAGVLMADMKSLDAKHFGGVPDSLMNQERDIRISLSYNKSRLQSELAKKDKQDTLKVDEIKEKIFALNREREALEELFEKNYAKYHELKYNNTQPTIQQIQNSLDEQTTLIEYFVGDSTTYAFTISKNDYQIKELPLIDSLGTIVQNLPNLLKAKDKEGFSTTAHMLYQKLFEPLNINTGVPDHTNLIIIPDGALWQLNFDLLISKKPEKEDYRKYQYLIKDYTISYAYSAKLLNQTVGQAVKTASKNEVLAFSYNNPDDISVGSYIAMRGFRNANLGDLPGTRKEIKAISTVVDGAYYYGSYANEKNFKENAKDYKILHLALHGVIDNEDPMKSKLYFTRNGGSQNKDTLEDNYLHAYELYNLELNADLAVLSACQTGSGKLIKGEGVMSLGRAFTYAGCRSLLLSQWDVSDAFTPGLMKDFYQNLKEGKTKAAALREAKLAYLSKADNLTSNPYYWAPLVQLGDNKPLKQDSYLVWIIGVSSLLVLIGVVVYLRRRKISVE